MRTGRLIGILLPLVITAVVALTLTIWLPRLPDPVATHWSAAPDGFTSRASFVPLTALLTAGTSLPSALLALTLGRGSWSGAHRALVSLAPAVAAFLGALMISLARAQLDLTDAAAASSPGLALPVLAGILMWVVAWVMSPAAHPRAGPATTPTDAPARGSARKSTDRTAEEWTATILPDAPLLVFVGVAMAPLLALSIWSLVAQEPGWWILPLTLVGTALFLGSFLAFRVHIDSRGLHARSLFGWPTFRVPASEIATIDVTTIDPLGDFGGWGLRWGRKRVGIVLRTGEGVLVNRTDGRVFGMTTDDAVRAAAALEAAAAHSPD